MKENKNQHVWRDYFSMLLNAGLPWVLMAVCFGLSMLKAIMSLALANQITVALKDYSNIKEAIPELWKLIGILLVGIAASVAGIHLQGIVGAQVDRNVQRYAVDNVLYLKTKDLEENDTRNFITRLTDDACKNSPFLIELTINEIPRIYYIIAAIIAVRKIGQPTLTGAMFLLIPCIVILSLVSGKITFTNRNKVQTKLAAVTAKLAEKIDDIELIKSYSTEEKEIKSGNEVLDELSKVRKEGALVDHINKYIKNMIWFIDVAIMVIPPTLLMFKGVIDRTVYYAYILLVSRFETYIREHLIVWVYLKEAQGATRRLSAVLNMENEKSVSAETAFNSGDIEFINVCFAYGEENVLNDVSFVIEKSKKTGIVGLSGSGKSTVLNLIEKFYEPDEGKILIGGKDISKLDYTDYRSRFAYLPQNAPCVSGTVREMLNYSTQREYSDEELVKALKDVMLYDDIMKLGGLDYQIGHNGENLSGGQRQKLGIARMLLSDSEYVMLDEATSALDPEATAAIQKKIDEKCRGKTLIVVAHDLSTIENADKVLVFDKGRMIAEGTHRQLKEKLPLYRDLVKGDR
ncbi:MAG: ABC transporter ATP-binding protein [Erysipelotrichaceae bacterium]|nr:ABC transporter ATP-binding protein [Erysipelotrichaceae bacterium]